ncbi:MAG: hypothetical protein WCC08_24030 [Terrimicrobiaceae bacterium]
MTHLVEIWSAWHGSYRLLGGVQAAAAVASLATSIMLVRLAPQGLTLPAPGDLRQTNAALEKEIAKRGQAETALAAAREIFERQVKEHADELLAVKSELAAEQEAMIRLHEFGARMPASTELQPVLGPRRGREDPTFARVRSGLYSASPLRCEETRPGFWDRLCSWKDLVDSS